jgi:hypothetical protein
MLLAVFELGLVFCSEDGGNESLRNVCQLVPNYMALQSRRLVPLSPVPFDEVLSNERVLEHRMEMNIYPR